MPGASMVLINWRNQAPGLCNCLGTVLAYVLVSKIEFFKMVHSNLRSSDNAIYNHPASVRVARIVGTPPMNLFEGRIAADGASLECAHFSAPLPLPGGVALPAGTGVTLGVRPEDIVPADECDPQAHQIRIASIEPLGGYTIVNALLGEQQVKIRAGAHVVGMGDLGTRVCFDERRLHLFDSEGMRIPSAG